MHLEKLERHKYKGRFLKHIRRAIWENHASACCRTPAKFANRLSNAESDL